MDTIIVQVQFEQQTDYGLFRDSLNIPKEEFDQMDELEIEERKQNRIDKWVAYMKNPPVAKLVSKVQLQIQADELSLKLSELKSKIESM